MKRTNKRFFVPIEKEQKITAVLHGTIIGLKGLIEKIENKESNLPDFYTEEFLQSQISICNSIYGGIKIVADLCNSTRKEEIYTLIHDNIRNLDGQLKQTVDEDKQKRIRFNIDQWENILAVIQLLDNSIDNSEREHPNLIPDLK